MRDRIQAILEREIDKLDSLSKTSAEPLSPAGIKNLDLLIKAHAAFVKPASEDPPPEIQPTIQDLINAANS